MFKKILLSLFIMLSVPMALASPDKEERCKFEAMITQQGFAARLSMDKDEFAVKLKEFVDAASKDKDVPKEQIDMAVKALKQGFAGMSPQKAFDACMRQKQT